MNNEHTKPDIISLFVPGRLCLFGEHSDWAGLQRTINADIVPGASIVTGIEQGIYADVERSDKFIMRNISPELKDTWVDFECSLQAGELKKVASSNSYFSYVAGVASYVFENYHVGGLKVTIQSMTLPVKSGLSSSAAICVLVARAFNILYRLNLNTRGEMIIAYKGERRTSSRCGRLDQACAFGQTPVLMTFDGEEIDVERLVVKKPFHWVFAHLKGNKDTIRILSDLNKCYPFAENELERNVHAALGSENKKIIDRAVEYLKKGEPEALGCLMTEAQQVFDKKVAPASPGELKAPILHRVLNDETVKKLSFGGKGVGSQGDGSIQLLAKDADSQKKLIEYLNSINLPAYSLTIQPCYRVHKAVIPVAGFGTRLYPATRAIKKEFIPIVDKDGLTKPAILVLLEQLYESGIDEICMVVGGDEDIDLYRRFFQEPLSEEHFQKLPRQMQEFEKKILDIGKRITYRIQKERRGFGHAVYQSRDFSGNEPVLLLLGDTLYHSNTNKTCSLQLIEAFEQINQPLVSIHEIPLAKVEHYGILTGVWEDKSKTQLQVTQFVEKPTQQYADDYLSLKGDGYEKHYYAVFGQYILTPEIFNALESNIANKTDSGSGEFGLTEAFVHCIGTVGLEGVVLQGTMFDLGNSEAYRQVASCFS